MAAVAAMLVCQMAGYHEGKTPWMPRNGLDLAEVKGWPEPRPGLLMFYYLTPYLKLWALIGGVVYHIVLLRGIPNLNRLLWPTWIACGFLALWAVSSDLHEQLEFSRLTVMGEPASLASYCGKLAMLVLICLLPAAALSYYAGCHVLDRYVFRSFLQPLVFCFAAICLLWVMWDMLDSLRDFHEAKTPALQIARFYLSLVPYIYVETMWAVLLLATVFTLAKMSRANEIISMLGAGRSLGQVFRPVIVLALIMSAVGLAANYHWAPRAEGHRKAIMRAMSSPRSGAQKTRASSTLTESLMYRDDASRRTWFIGSFPFSLRDDKMKGVEVFIEDEKGRLVRSIRAPTVAWWPEGRWSFYHAVEVSYHNGSPQEVIRYGMNNTPTRLDITDWNDTPWSIISSSLQPDFMSVQELVSYLRAHSALAEKKLAAFRTHFFHRFAHPFLCLIAACVAAPLAVSFSRRGVIGGIAGAIAALGSLLFLNQLFLSLGKGMRVPAPLAVWIPHLILAAVAAILFYYRSQNRDLPGWRSLAALLRSQKTPSSRSRA